MNIKQASKILDNYMKRYKDAGRSYNGNVVSDKWSMHDIAKAIGTKELEGLIDYYFDEYGVVDDGQWFFYNYYKVLEHKNRLEKDRERIATLKSQTKRVMNERRS